MLNQVDTCFLNMLYFSYLFSSCFGDVFSNECLVSKIIEKSYDFEISKYLQFEFLYVNRMFKKLSKAIRKGWGRAAAIF